MVQIKTLNHSDEEEKDETPKAAHQKEFNPLFSDSFQ